MNISRYERRVLHALAQGGRIAHRRDQDSGRTVEAMCLTREGYVLFDCTLPLFRRFKRRGLIVSTGGQPWHHPHEWPAVRAQLDDR